MEVPSALLPRDPRTTYRWEYPSPGTSFPPVAAKPTALDQWAQAMSSARQVEPAQDSRRLEWPVDMHPLVAGQVDTHPLVAGLDTRQLGAWD